MAAFQRDNKSNDELDGPQKVKQLCTSVKLGAISVATAVTAICGLVQSRWVVVPGAVVLYGCYEVFTTAKNVYKIYSSVTQEVYARSSHEHALNAVADSAPVTRMLLELSTCGDLHKRLFQKK